MVEVLIEEMNGSDRSRPKDYKRALVATRRPARKPTKTTLRSGGSIALEKRKKVTRNCKKSKKGLDRADIVRDYRLSDKSGPSDSFTQILDKLLQFRVFGF